MVLKAISLTLLMLHHKRSIRIIHHIVKLRSLCLKEEEIIALKYCILPGKN